MKKVLFFMFLLFLGLGTASVNAQVRIGGNTAPNGAAALDLNATDATNNGTKGLALPRVNLTSNTMQLTSGVVNLTGMLVYNTTATLGAVGIYFWNGATWVKASLPSTSAADSGKYLMSNGTAWVASTINLSQVNNVDTISLLPARPAVTWSLVADTPLVLKKTIQSGQYGNIIIPNLNASDVCVSAGSSLWEISMYSGGSRMTFVPTNRGPIHAGATLHVRCFRPSF